MNKIKKGVVFNKIKTLLEKFGMQGKEEGFTRVKDLIWKWEEEDADLMRMTEASLQDIRKHRKEDIWGKYIKKCKTKTYGGCRIIQPAAPK